jgi:putative SOS response-associated peptidase YedK
MCGRYSLRKNPQEYLREYFPGIEFDASFDPVLNEEVRPTDVCPVVASFGRKIAFTGMRWGFVPSWSKTDPPVTGSINARIETITQKPSFQASFKRRRCIVPADSFYEWGTLSGLSSKRPYEFRHPQSPFLMMGGIWDEWEGARGCLRTFAIITTTANASVSKLHHRMPYIFDQKGALEWMRYENFKEADLKRLMSVQQPDLSMKEASLSSAKQDSPEQQQLF